LKSPVDDKKLIIGFPGCFERENLSRDKGAGRGLEMTEAKKPTNGKEAAPAKKASEYTQARYWTRIAKGTALPLLYTVMSIILLRKYVLEWPHYYDYKVLFIVLGVFFGLLTMTGITAYNVIRARKNPSKGIKMDSKIILFTYIPVLFIIVILALIAGISTAWQFSIGFFGTSIVPPLLVVLIEAISKGKFFVRETEKPETKRLLVMVPNTTG
jgi:hypothetical protein